MPIRARRLLAGLGLTLLMVTSCSPPPPPTPTPSQTPAPTLAPTPKPTSTPTPTSSPKGLPQPVAAFLPDAGPVNALIGESFTFQVSFENDATSPGYGPFIDIAMDSRGVSNYTAGGPCDGISFTSAQLADVNATPSVVPVTNVPLAGVSPCNPTSPSPASVSHPYPSGSSVTLPAAGWQLNTLTLPFGSFYKTQPPVVVDVTAFVSELANNNEPLKVCIRGGFQGKDAYLNYVTTQFGDAVQDNAGQDLWLCKVINPVVFTVNKAYLGPENEAVAGPNFSSLGMAGYQLTVNIANHQTIYSLLIQDPLSNDLQYVAGQTPVVLQPAGWAIITGPCASTPANQISLSPLPPNSPGGTISFQLCAPLTGTTADNEVQLKFLTFVPSSVVGDDCTSVPVGNKVTAQGKWQPLDQRDGGWQMVTSHDALIITAKCLAVQKSVADQTHPGQTVPGDLLKYTITFQVSDYFTIGQLIVKDVLADGQSFVASGGDVPTLTVGDQTLPMSPLAPFPIHAVTVTPDETASCKAGPPGHEQTVVGATDLTFDVSQTMNSMYPPASRLGQGILTGGWAASPSSTTPATGTITFYARVDDQFVYAHPGIASAATDRSVNKLDPINNCVSMIGVVYTNQSPVTVTNLVATSDPEVKTTDDSVTQLIITDGQFTKSIVAKNGVPIVSTGVLPTFAADDLITFELKYYRVPSSDAQRLTITDWLPQPVLNVVGFSTTLSQCPQPTIPGLNQACYVALTGGTVFTPPTPSAGPNTVVANSNDNSLTFDFGTFYNLSNSPSPIIIYFTMQLTDAPYADLLHLTNVAQECEGNAILPSTQFCQVAVAPFILSEPALRIRKGVIKAKPATAVFDPAPPLVLPSPFPPTAAQPVTGVNLGNYFESNVTGGADAGDSLIFAIVVENYGSSLHGAFNVEVKDTLPPGLICYPGTVTVTYGDGTPITPIYYPLTPSTCTASGFDLTLPDISPSQGSLDVDANASGPSSDPRSLAIITFRADLADTITPTCDPGLTNVAQITNYAADAGGPNFVPYHLGGPLSADAWVCIRPTLTKSIVTTSEPSTPVGDPTPLTIGEIVRYRLQIKLPEANYPGFTITDQLPAGLSYLPGATTKLAFVSKLPQNITSTPIIPLGAATIDGDQTSIAGITPVYPFPTNDVSGGSFNCSTPGTDPTFKLGDVVNLANNPEVEYIVLEFNAIVCNITANQDPGTRDNTFEVNVAGADPPTYSSNPIQATIVEPKLVVTKETMRHVTSTEVGDYLGYKITLTNIGNAAAFDVVLSDTYSLAGMPSAFSSITAVPDDHCSLNVTQVICNYIPANSTPVTITYWIYVTADHVVVPDCTTTNTSTVTWTSLPGEGSPVSTLPKHNLTGSQTQAGSSGTSDGERTGAGGVNDYYQSYSLTTPVDNSPSINCPPPAKPDLAITKTQIKDLWVGALVWYRLGVTNVGGDVPANTPIIVTDTLPAGLTYMGAIAYIPGTTPVSPWLWACLFSNNTVTCTWTGGPVGAGQVLPAIFIAVMATPAAAPGPLTNCADVSVTNDADLNNNQACITSPVYFPRPDLAITKTLIKELYVGAATSAWYQLGVTNIGAAVPANTPIIVTDTLPAGLTYMGAIAYISGTTPVSPWLWVCSVSGNTVTCTWPGGLGPGQSLPAIFIAVMATPAAAPGPLTNCADVSVTNDADLNNNQACSTNPVYTH